MKIIESIKLRWVVWVWNRTPTCAEMARLASQSLDRPLPLKTRLKMRLHSLICVWCERYFKQLHRLHRAAPQFDEKLDGVSKRALSADARQRIKVRLQHAAKD